MAFSKTPTQSTYETKRISFISNPQQRSGSTPEKDFRLVNMMVEVVPSPTGDGKKFYVKSRPGLSAVYTQTAGLHRGIYFWNYLGTETVIHVIGNTVYGDGPGYGAAIFTLQTSTGLIGFAEHVDDTGKNVLVLVDGTNGYVFEDGPFVTPTPIIPETQWAVTTAYTTGQRIRPSGGFGAFAGFAYEATTGGTSDVTEPVWPTTAGDTVVDGSITWTCRDCSFPSPHVPFVQFIDGYVVVAKENTQDMYNCNLNKPLWWTAGDYISAEMYPDHIVALSKNNNYLYAIGTNSVEYFYDAANATRSPFARHESAVQQFGCAAPGTVVQTEKEVIFVGETGNGGHTVWTIDGFKEKEIGIPMVKAVFLQEGAGLADITAHCVRVSGQKLYIIVLSTRTLVYSFDTQMWSEWTSDGGTTFICNFATDGTDGAAFIAGKTDGIVYKISENYFTDNGAAFECSLTSAKLDFDSLNRKFMGRLSIIGDVPDDTLVDSAVSIQWSDDDYKTWSAARTLTFNADFPTIFQLGAFRRRALKLTYSLPHLLRLEGVEVDINIGNA